MMTIDDDDTRASVFTLQGGDRVLCASRQNLDNTVYRTVRTRADALFKVINKYQSFINFGLHLLEK